MPTTLSSDRRIVPEVAFARLILKIMPLLLQYLQVVMTGVPAASVGRGLDEARVCPLCLKSTVHHQSLALHTRPTNALQRLTTTSTDCEEKRDPRSMIADQNRCHI